MKFSELDSFPEEYLDNGFDEFLLQFTRKESIEYLLMWDMCRDKYDKAIMMSYWYFEKAVEPKDSHYQNALMEKCESIVSNYMNEVPTWADIILK